MSVVNVGNLLLLALAFVIITESTLEKDRMSALNVGSLLTIGGRSFDTGEFTQERDPMAATTAGKLSPTCHALCITRGCYMQERNVVTQSSWKILSQSISAHHVQVIWYRGKTLLVW